MLVSPTGRLIISGTPDPQGLWRAVENMSGENISGASPEAARVTYDGSFHELVGKRHQGVSLCSNVPWSFPRDGPSESRNCLRVVRLGGKIDRGAAHAPPPGFSSSCWFVCRIQLEGLHGGSPIRRRWVPRLARQAFQMRRLYAIECRMSNRVFSLWMTAWEGDVFRWNHAYH